MNPHILQLFDLKRKGIAKAAEFHLPNNIRNIAWHPDGKRLVVACQNARTYLLDIGSEQIIRTIYAHDEHTQDLYLSPDGTLLLSWGWDNTTRLHDMLMMSILRIFISAPMGPYFSVGDGIIPLDYTM